MIRMIEPLVERYHDIRRLYLWDAAWTERALRNERAAAFGALGFVVGGNRTGYVRMHAERDRYADLMPS